MEYNFNDIIKINPKTVGESNLDIAISPKDFAARLNGSSIELIQRMTKEIDQPILKDLAKDLLTTFTKFYNSEEALCCLIKNIIGLEKINELRDAVLKDPNNPNDNSFVIEISMPLIEHLIAIIDIIITFMELDLSDLIMPFLDFSKLLANGIVGALIMTLQQIVFTLRDTLIAWIIDELKKKQKEDGYAFLKCAPFMDLVDIMKKYIHDYGILAKLMSLISGYIGGQHMLFKGYLDKLPKNLHDIEFLKRIRAILVQIKGAVLKWDLCVDQDFAYDPMIVDMYNDKVFGTTHPSIYDDNNKFGQMNTGTPMTKDVVLTDKDSILTNKAYNGRYASDLGETGSGKDISYMGNGKFVIPSDGEVNNFLTNYLGLSQGVADYLITNDDRNQQGTLGDNTSSTNSDCGYSFKQNDIASILQGLLRNT